MDELQIEKLTADDKIFLATFTSLERLSLNGTGLRSLENFPKNENLVRLELYENKIYGDQLKHLAVYASSLKILKLASNKISSLKELDTLVRKFT